MRLKIYLLLIFLIIEISNLINSLQSWFNELYITSSRYPVSFKIESQYSVSLASFNAIFNLLVKSAFEGASCASAIFAPIEVPLLKICLPSINSFFSLIKNWYSLTILIENLYDFSFNKLDFISKYNNLPFTFYHLPIK